MDSELKKELEEIDGIKNIDILGGTERKISIALDFQKLNKSGISYNQISDALSASNISFPGGTLKENEKNIPILFDFQTFIVIFRAILTKTDT